MSRALRVGLAASAILTLFPALAFGLPCGGVPCGAPWETGAPPDSDASIRASTAEEQPADCGGYTITDNLTVELGATVWFAACAGGSAPTATDTDICPCDNQTATDATVFRWYVDGAYEATGDTFSHTFPGTPGRHTVVLYVDDVHVDGEPPLSCANDSRVPEDSIGVTLARLIMLTPPEDQTTAYVGATSGTKENRWFYKAFVADTQAETDTLDVTIHMVGDESKAAPSSGSGEYTTANWDITTKHSPKTLNATAPHATQSGNATLHFKKNRQLATWAPDYVNCGYVWGAEGPCGSGFDCSGFQYYMYVKVGYSYARTTAQGCYNASTHVSSDNALPGDWIFFDWDNEPPSGTSIDHTGCYTGVNGSGHRLMTHASAAAGKVVTVDLTTYMPGHTGLYGHRYGANERF